jgi:hypothetical protein
MNELLLKKSIFETKQEEIKKIISTMMKTEKKF